MKIKSYCLTTVREFRDLEKNYKGTWIERRRAGIIPFTKNDKGRIVFGLGLDSRTHELTDFGGSLHHGEKTVEGALRELEEESLGLFSNLKVEDIMDCVVIYNHRNFIIFLHFDSDESLSRISQLFLERHEVQEYDPEICSIVWMDWKNLVKIIMRNERPTFMFERVRKFLLEAIEELSYSL